MDEVKDKFKGFIKKVNFSSSSSSSSSRTFQGQGRVLGSASSSSSSSSSSSPSPYRQTNPPPKPQPSPHKAQTSDHPKPDSTSYPKPHPKPSNGFDPYESLMTSGKRSQNGYSLEIFECPICQLPFKTVDEVSNHVESCVNENNNADTVVESNSSPSQLDTTLCTYLSGNPGAGSVEVVLKLLRNIVREPGNPKFRRVRMSNPKIKEAVADKANGVEVMEAVGFVLSVEDDDETWATMDVPSEDGMVSLRRAVEVLESSLREVVVAEQPRGEAVLAAVEPKKIDRQTKVFFSVSENLAAKIDLPDSFYNLSMEELKREADSRKKKIAESQLLVPKSFKEKQAKAAQKKHTKTIIRIQFPDKVVLQGIFNPWEPTSSLYEFVSSALKEPSLQFELLHPMVIKRRVIPCFPPPGKNSITLKEEDLVPKALVKFRPIETDSLVFTGLCNELLEISEPLVVDSPVVQ